MNEIIVVHDPKIELDELSIKDTEKGTDPNYKPKGYEEKYSKFLGDYQPYVVINGLSFQDADLQVFVLDYSGFLPRLTLSVNGKGGMFTTKSYPKDGDLVSLLIKSNNKDFKPIRQDYEIISVSSAPSQDDKGENSSFGIEAILSVPKINIDRIKSYSKKKSVDVITDISKDLKLGLAVNDSSLEDEMTWLLCTTSYYDFLLNDVVAAAYKDDTSFFNAFIDQYYYLNFIEINQLISHSKKLDKQIINYLSATDHHPDDPENKNRDEKPLMLSNSVKVQNTANKISGYTLTNKSGVISFCHGYRNYVQYYNKKEKSFEQYFIETLTTDGSDDKIILKQRENVDHTKYVKAKLAGIQCNDNVHKNYNHAKIQNYLNLQELEKVNLSIDSEGINFNFYKYQLIPVYIFTGDSNHLRAKANLDKKEGYSLDKFVSGWYLITNIFHIYDWNEKKFFTRFFLARREYDKPNEGTTT